MFSSTFKKSSTINHRFIQINSTTLRTNDVNATSNLPTVVGLLIAFPLWYFVFSTDLMDGFWNRLVLAVSILGLHAFVSDRKPMLEQLKKINPKLLLLGVFSGLVLYLIFYGGYNLFKPFLQQGAWNVYRLIGQASAGLVAATLVFTSFCEEFFWRGFIQRNLMNSLGRLTGLILSTAFYTFIHIFTMNIALMVAAMIAGLWWGALYLSTRMLWLTVASHIVWTELVLLILPLR